MLVVGGMLFVFCIFMYLYFNVFVSPRDEDVSLVIQGLGGKANQEKEPMQKHTNTNTNTKNRYKGGGDQDFRRRNQFTVLQIYFAI